MRKLLAGNCWFRFVVSHPFARKTANGWGTQHLWKIRSLGSSRISLLALALLVALAGCHSAPRDPRTVVFLIESSPANLDPRIGTDAQSEHIDELLFDGLVAHDASFHFTPALAESWEQPDPLTLVFHLRERSSLPRWPPADGARCGVDDQLNAQRAR